MDNETTLTYIIAAIDSVVHKCIMLILCYILYVITAYLVST